MLKCMWINDMTLLFFVSMWFSQNFLFKKRFFLAKKPYLTVERQEITGDEVDGGMLKCENKSMNTLHTFFSCGLNINFLLLILLRE